MKAKCHEAENGQFDTAGNPVKIRVCYCGTTACQYLGSAKYHDLPRDFGEVVGIDRPCQSCNVPKIYKNDKCPNH